MRLLAGVDLTDAGTRTLGHQVRLDYFAQDQASILNPTRTVYEEMASESPTTMVPLIRTILGGFLFSGDDVYKKVAVLSGGERNRLALAKMLLNPSNVLLLDEPTNHLDLDSKEILLDALSDYGGTLVFVSHDRYFVDRLASRVVEVGGGAAVAYPGGYEDFLDWKKRREAGLQAALPTAHGPAPRTAPAQPARPARVKAVTAVKPPAKKGRQPATPPAYDPMAPRLRPASNERPRDARKLQSRVADLERQITEKEAALKALEKRMAGAGFYSDRVAAAKVLAEHQALSREVDALMAEWETAQQTGPRSEPAPSRA
jgi:ATP-binding cassette subfamily F protein 3